MHLSVSSVVSTKLIVVFHDYKLQWPDHFKEPDDFHRLRGLQPRTTVPKGHATEKEYWDPGSAARRAAWKYLEAYLRNKGFTLNVLLSLGLTKF